MRCAIMGDFTRRTVLRGLVGASAVAAVGVDGTSRVAAQTGQWSAPPGVARQFSLDTGEADPSRVDYEAVPTDEPADATIDVDGTAPAGPNGNVTRPWFAEYDGLGNEQYSATVYQGGSSYPTWDDPFIETFTSGAGTILIGLARDSADEIQALYAARVVNDTETRWTTTFAADVDWTRDRLFNFSNYGNYTVDPGEERIATAGETDPLVHDDWIKTDGTVTRNLTVTDSSLQQVDFVDHYRDKPWVYMFGTATGGGIVAQAASPNDDREWRTSLAEFDAETFLAGSFNTITDETPAFAIASDAAGTGSWIKTLEADGTVVDSTMYTPPTGGDSATGAQPRFFSGGYFTSGPTDSGSWVRSIAEDFSVNWTTTIDGAFDLSGFFGGSVRPVGTDGYLVSGRKNDAPAFWRLSADGSVRWSTSVGNTTGDSLSRVGVGPDDAFILAGRTESLGPGELNPWLVRINDSDGSVAWQETYGDAGWSVTSFRPSTVGENLIYAETSDSTVELLELSPSASRDDEGDGGIISQYDENGDGAINNSELLAALAEYPEQVSNQDLLELLSVYDPGQ